MYMHVRSWGKRAAHNRAQIVYYIAENLELRRSEVASRIAVMTGRDEADCHQEVDLAIQRLFYWGAYADKYGGTVQVSGCGLFYWGAYADKYGGTVQVSGCGLFYLGPMLTVWGIMWVWPELSVFCC